MDCYDASWCPDAECDICDFWISCEPSRARRAWMKVRRFFVRLWRRDFSTGYVYLGATEDVPCATQPPVYATHEDALRDVMRSGRAAVFEADERGGYRKTWEDARAPVSPGKDGGK